MNLILITRFFFLFQLVVFGVFAQNDNTITKGESDSLELDLKRKVFSANVTFYKPITTDKSFIGQGTRGEAGFDIGIEVFVYKNFFVGSFAGYSFLDVVDNELVGNYKRSRVFNMFLEVGYELPITKTLSLGASVAPLGYASYRNYIDKGRLKQQRDSASSTAFRANINYQFGEYAAVFICYSFRNDNSKIETAPEIQDNFSKIQYHNIGIGLKLVVFQ